METSRGYAVGRLLLVLSMMAAAELMTPCLGDESYVVYMGSHTDHEGRKLALAVHHRKLTDVLGSPAAARKSLLYSYHNINAFAAKISSEHAAILSGHKDVISVFPNKPNTLHTTRSWEFLGLEDSSGAVSDNSLWTKSNYGQDVIIGIIDTGIWPESASYEDQGFGEIPSRWKGECTQGDEFGPKFCNKKLIGGRYFLKGFEAVNGPVNRSAGNFISARDSDGHGTHTSSTAGGSFSPNVSTLGFAQGTAKGGAPFARVAMYKVCWVGEEACYDADILAALDQGISDGVDVFSLSLGSPPPLPNLFADAISIGSFHAVQNNISVIASAGNDGPNSSSVANVAPWITTVAASSIDRDFPSSAMLGSKLSVTGESLSTDHLDTLHPLVSSATVFSNVSNSQASLLCSPGSLDPDQVKGKIVACTRGVVARIEKGEVVKEAGGVGMILLNDVLSGNELVSDPHVLPATQVTYTDGIKVVAYINSTEAPVASLSDAKTVLGEKPAPVLTSFSSQGPNSLIPDILKPDIAAPGLNILAAWSEAVSITGLPGDNRIVKYNIISGTSMACPHVAGITASLRAYHPTWSPAAIHSAIVTTANQRDNSNGMITGASKQIATPFGLGGGNVAPNAAAEPGLVYDNSPADYFPLLCNIGFTDDNIFAISGKNYTCHFSNLTVSDFNYPSLTVATLDGTQTVTRTVTNVGNATSTYTCSIVDPPGIKTTISPSKLTFSALGEQQTFSVTFTTLNSTAGEFSFGSFTWSDGTHSVRSPLVIQTVS